MTTAVTRLTAEMHKSLLQEVADKVQLPIGTTPGFADGEKGITMADRERKVFYEEDATRLAQGFMQVQKGPVEAYPAKRRILFRLDDDRRFPGIGQKYGFGAILFETKYQKPFREERAGVGKYIDRVVPGGFILLWLGQFKSQARKDQVFNYFGVRLKENECLTPKPNDFLARAAFSVAGIKFGPATSYWLFRKR